jgi:hypothetical protein
LERAYDGACERNEEIEQRLNECREWLNRLWHRGRYNEETQVLHVPLTRDELERLGQVIV